MKSKARRAAFSEALAQSLETLERTATVRVERRDHDDDALTRWRAGMPKSAPTLTAAAVEEKIAEAVAAHRAVWIDVQARAIAHERQLHRNGVAKTRAELLKRIGEDRTLARHELDRQRADHDRRLASQREMIMELRATVAGLESRVATLTQKQAIEAKVIDLPNPLWSRRG
jgi:RNA-binding protein YhbY